MTIWRGLLPSLICAGLPLASGCDAGTLPGEPVAELRTSFESGLDGWTPAATDIWVGDEPIDWHVRHSTVRAVTGNGSAEVYLQNLTDAAKVWITRPVQLEPRRRYVVDIDFRLGTADWGDVNLFSVLAGALPGEPVTNHDLAPVMTREPTGHGQDSDVGYVWIRKQFRTTVTAGADGRIYPVIGIWGMHEVTRTYYLDDLTVRIFKG